MAAPAHAPVLSGIQKAAILLISVGDQASAELLKRLSDDEVQAVTGRHRQPAGHFPRTGRGGSGGIPVAPRRTPDRVTAAWISPSAF